MTTSNDHAKSVAASLAKLLQPGADVAEVAAIIQDVLDAAADERGKDAEDLAQTRATRLLSASPAVTYSFRAVDDYAPTFVSDNITRLLGYCPEKYMENADFWRSHVHPDDLAAVEADEAKVFENGRHVSEYRFRKRNGTYIWVRDEQYMLRDDDGAPSEGVGSWSNITTRKQAEESSNAARARFDMMLHSELLPNRWTGLRVI